MKKELKNQVIESISAELKEYPNFYVTDIAGLNAKDTGKLRRACFEEGIKLSVVKNTLFAHVLKGTYMKSAALCSTMSAGVKIDLKAFLSKGAE